MLKVGIRTDGKLDSIVVSGVDWRSENKWGSSQREQAKCHSGRRKVMAGCRRQRRRSGYFTPTFSSLG